MSGKLKMFFKPRVSELGACKWKNMLDAMDAAKTIDMQDLYWRQIC